MSYGTRSGRAAGRGVQPTQLTYHQPPRQPHTASPFQQQFQQAVFPKIEQPVPPGAASPAQQQQMQQQQQQLQHQQLQQQQPTPPPSQFNMQQLPGTPPTPPKPQAPVVTPQQAQAHSESGDVAPKDDSKDVEMSKPWKKNKNPSFKVNKVLKRRRQNARFRKLLIPKNAIMVLNELQPGVSFEAEEHSNAFSQLSYTVRINIDGAVYTGEGFSKAAAKAAAAEHAVKGLIMKKINESSFIKRDESTAAASEEDMDACDDDSSDKTSTNGKRLIPEDEVPWGSLASFALFKLFADWKAQGTNIPVTMAPTAPKPIPKVPGPGVKPPTVPVKGTIPENPELLHPVTLVGRVYPGTLFYEIMREGTPPHLIFYIGATVNDVKYQGFARNKKEAKKNCAIEILKAAQIPYNANS